MEDRSFMSLTSQIKELGEEIGLDVIRVTNAENYPETEKQIKFSIEQGYIPEIAFNNSIPSSNIDINKVKRRCNPRSILKRAKSVISVAQCYMLEETEDNKKNNERLLGKIAKYDAGNFYKDTSLKLKKIINFINLKTDSKYKSKNKSCYVSLTEKPIAERAGVGWYGKNGIIITEGFGSWVVLGEIITELELEIDSPLYRDCGSCKICMDWCPTQAIAAPYIINRTRCLQYISERPMKVPLSFREVWGDRLYGCMTCQEVCPENHKVKPKKYRPEYGFIGTKIPLIPLLTITEREFQNYFACNQIAMRSRETIKRNSILVLGNIGDPKALLPLINVLQEDSNAMVRGHSAWALGKIKDRKGKVALEKALVAEEDREVKEEIINALEMF